jgi:subtilisin family serine protease
VAILGQSLSTGIDRIDAESTSSPSAAANTMSKNATATKMSNLENVQIGIIDTGIDLENEELNVVDDVSFIAGEPTGQDGNGHGTHVAGIAAAKNDNDGVVGVAPGAKLTAIKVLGSDGSGSTASVLAGLDYALQHANELDVVNLSLGGPGSSVATDTAITKLQNAGVPVVVAAGNDNEDAAFFSPANAPDAWTVSSIADTDGKCGGLGGANDDSFSSFSNWGSVVEIAAPGGQINSTLPNGEFAQFSGTSMAAPHVAGAVALYKSSHPDASPIEIFNRLIETANTSGTACDTSANNGKGYIETWDSDGDDIREPLLYVKEFVTTK